MNISLYRNELLTKGAILGCVMLASKIAETAILYYGGASWLTLMGLESLLMMAVYVFLIYRFTKSYSELVVAERKQAPYFSYGEGLLYAMNLSGLAGIVVAIGGYLYMHYAVGYENFIDAYIKLLQDVLSQLPLSVNDIAQLRKAFSELQKSVEPSILSNLLSVVSQYVMTGAFVGLVVAAFTKRNLVMFGTSENLDNNENKPEDEQ